MENTWVGDVTGVSMINEALGEPPDDSKTVFGFAKQGNAAVGTYFVRVEFSNYFAGSFRTGAVCGCFESFEG